MGKKSIIPIGKTVRNAIWTRCPTAHSRFASTMVLARENGVNPPVAINIRSRAEEGYVLPILGTEHQKIGEPDCPVAVDIGSHHSAGFQLIYAKPGIPA